MATAPPTATKPSRSDDVLDADQQLRLTAEARLHFESLVPKRPKKPSRSESTAAEDDAGASPAPGGAIPEFYKLQSLRSRPPAAGGAGGGSSAAVEDFVETQYYQTLISIDKQHHTTGCGFIRQGLDRERDGASPPFRPQEFHGLQTAIAASRMSNPATNDWIPRIDDEEFQGGCASSKPARSEGVEAVGGKNACVQ